MIEKILLNVIVLLDTKSFGIKQKIFFLRQLGYFLKGGVSITEALTIIKDTSKSIYLKQYCESVLELLNLGEPLSRSLLKAGDIFNVGDYNIVLSGEEAGELANVLEYLADQYEFLFSVKKNYQLALSYPIMLLIVSIGVVFVLFSFVLPNILEVVTEIGNAELPASTQFLMTLTSFFSNNYGKIIFTTIFGSVFIAIALGFDGAKDFIDKKILKVPLIGKLTQYYLLLKFLRYLKLLLVSGLSYSQIFTNLKGIMGSGIYNIMLEDVLDGINKGELFVSSLSKYEYIVPQDVIMLLKVGEETATLDKSIDNLVQLYNREFNHILNSLGKVIEPIMVCIMGVLVGFVALSVFGVVGSVLDSVSI